MQFDDLATMIVATAALGNAASAIVQALKWGWLRMAGFGRIRGTLGAAMMGAVESALGPNADELLRAQYRHGRSKGSLGQTLRQGVRIGLTPDNAEELASATGLAVRGGDLANLAVSLLTVDDVSSSKEQRAVLARYELVADQRITAALALAEEDYGQWVRLWAAVLSVGLALIASRLLLGGSLDNWLFRGLVIGLAAVPLAPVSHDLQKAFAESRAAVRAGRKQ